MVKSGQIKTSYEILNGRKFPVKILKEFGEMCVVKREEQFRSKKEDKGEYGMILGYAMHHTLKT